MSSRSHQIIRLTIESASREFSGRDNTSTLTATVNFVDLAGSERASQSLSAGARLKEGCHINRSLLTLGTVIRKLSKSRSGHIPYRDSKLTRILQNSLGGNAKTSIICTMSPARTHVEQSRNTLLFASCAKEVTTNARVNVVVSDKALVKYLQRELARMESELRSPRPTFPPSDYSAVVREKDFQIEKLVEEINDVILQRDVARSQVKDLLRILGDDSNSTTQAGLGDYPHLRVLQSPENELRTPILSDPHSLDEDSRTNSMGHIVEVPYFEDSFSHNNNNTSPRVLTSNSSERYSYHGWEEIDKQSNGTSEDLCREVRCIENEEMSKESPVEFPDIEVSENVEMTNLESPLSATLEEEQVLEPLPPSKNVNEIKEEKEKSLNRFLDVPVLEHQSPVSVNFKFTKSQSCKASVDSPWLKTIDLSENTTFFESERENKPSPLSCKSDARSFLPGKDPETSPRNALDIEMDSPNVKFPNSEDVGSSTDDLILTEMTEIPMEHVFEKKKSKEIDQKMRKNVKDVGLDPIEDEPRDHSNWPTEFKRLQREIIELWHACNVSLVHRTYFIMLFQGEPSDAVYLEVEIRRMKFLKQKFSKGDKTTANGKCITLDSSAKALREERRMLSQRMRKKLSEQERESLYLKWGIGLNTKLRRLQLAHRLWTQTDEMDHISDSAFLVAKLVGTVEPGQTHDKEMFGLNFAPRNSTRTYSLKKSLVSFL